MDTIILKNIRLYAYHGCLDEEARIGSDYSVNLEIETNFDKSRKTDELEDTVDYVHLNKIVREEMAIRSKLLEHVADRILKRLFDEIKEVSRAEISVSKLNPPIEGDVESVTIRIAESR